MYKDDGKLDKTAYKDNQDEAQKIRDQLLGTKTLTKEKDPILVKLEEEGLKRYLQARKHHK